VSETLGLVLPDPRTVAVAEMGEACRAVYDRRDQLIGSLPLSDAVEYQRQSTAIETYLRGTESYPDAQRAARVLEMAVGAALGPARKGPGNLASGQELETTLRHEFRVLNAGRARIEPFLEVDGLSREAALRIVRPGRGSVFGTGQFEWFTPPHIIDAARRVMGGIDLDPASTPEANAVVGALRFYTMADDGLRQPWAGRVWMNPPFAEALVRQFVDRLLEGVRLGNVSQACVLTNNATETRWFQELARAAQAICFPEGRLPFWHPGRPPVFLLQGQAVCYLGTRVDEFRAEFARFGFAVRP
jgi:hypothetical protein